MHVRARPSLMAARNRHFWVGRFASGVRRLRFREPSHTPARDMRVKSIIPCNHGGIRPHSHYCPPMESGVRESIGKSPKWGPPSECMRGWVLCKYISTRQAKSDLSCKHRGDPTTLSRLHPAGAWSLREDRKTLKRWGPPYSMHARLDLVHPHQHATCKVESPRANTGTIRPHSHCCAPLGPGVRERIEKSPHYWGPSSWLHASKRVLRTHISIRHTTYKFSHVKGEFDHTLTTAPR